MNYMKIAIRIPEHFVLPAIFEGKNADAIALALRNDSLIYVAEEVLAAAGIDIPAEEEDELDKFREFLDQVKPEDFNL